jgi:large subunit ribosomal protein L10
VDREQKAQAVAALKDLFSSAGVVVLTHNNGLTVAEVTQLRRKMRDAGASFKVAKNRLAQIALRGTTYEPISDLFRGPTGIAYSSDVIAAAKVAVTFAKGNERFVILGGAMGQTRLDPNGVKALAEMPSLDELRGKLVGLLQAPATKIAGVLQAPGSKLARVFAAYGAKGEKSEAA